MTPPVSDYAITERFKNAIEWLLPHEAVFQKGHYGDYNFVVAECVPGDGGGVTKFGVDQRSHPNVNIRALTFSQAVMIYLHSYWLPCRAESFPPGYGEVMFDIRVNGGNGPELLQAGLAAIGQDVGAIDGVVGPKTKLAMVAAGKAGLKAFLQQREARYNHLADNNHAFEDFREGWLNRNHDLAKFVGVTL